jgi:predicted anti-sigma-YlaC factor YlaD
MKCDEVFELMPDLAAGSEAIPQEVGEHLRMCTGCAGKLEEFRQTMALLDEWQVPEPSPYFDVRLRARLREEAAKPVSWLHWLRKPVLAASLALALVAGVTLFRSDAGYHNEQVAWEPGTAVGDLQALDKNNEVYADFDVLDDLQVQPDVGANQ